jgi:translation elongation factor EF-Ts
VFIDSGSNFASSQLPAEPELASVVAVSTNGDFVADTSELGKTARRLVASAVAKAVQSVIMEERMVRSHRFFGRCPVHN